MKSISKIFKKDTILTVKKNSIMMNLKKNMKYFIRYSSELSNLKDSKITTVSIKWFIKKKTSEFSLKNNSNYSFNSTLINNVKTVYKFCTCLFKTVSLTRTLNDLHDEIVNNYCLVNKYDMKKEEAVYIFIQ